jgi:hypothetical protein
MTTRNSRGRWFPRLMVLATGAAIGVFVWYTYFTRVPHLYPLEFKQGQWLVASDEGPQGYFRKELYVSETVQQAWIMVAAIDSFIVYLNGKAVGGVGYASMNVSGIYDIGPYLSPGKNVLGVTARRITYPGPAMAVVEGAYRDQTGSEHVLATDTSWKFSSVEQTQGAGGILWYSEAFDATLWPLARTAGRPEPSEIYPLGVHPLAFSMPPQGKWIGYSSAPQDRPTFAYTLDLLDGVEEVWLRIAAAQSYALTINGVSLRGELSQDLPLMGLDDASVWKSDGRMSTDVYHITSLLRTGPNRITVSPEQVPFLDGLLVDGFVIRGSEVLPFGTDSRWTIAVPPGITNSRQTGHPNPIILANNVPLPAKNVMRAILPFNYNAKQAGSMALVILSTVGVIYLLWQGTSRLLSRLQGHSADKASSVDALLHLPTLWTLGGLYLLSLDVRFDPAFPFQARTIWTAITLLLALKSLLILEALLQRKWAPRATQPSPIGKHHAANVIQGFVLLCLLTVGAFLRLHNLDGQSLYHDEVHMVAYVQGFFEKGYPHKMIGPIERPLATYELVPYPIAVSAWLFGVSDFALRLPAALFGIITIFLIYFVGRQVFDQRVGLLAASIYTFCPQALIWAKYLWHPQQTQFFALLTSYLFFRAIRDQVFIPKYLYLAAAAFIITYLSWEGAGFFLPALGLGLLAVRGKDFSWARDRHLWIAAGLIMVAVVLQLIRRILLQFPYLVVGEGLSDVSLPTFYFLDPMYDSTFYIKNFLWLANNALLTVFIFSTLPFLFRRSGFAYYFTVLMSILFIMTTLLTNTTIRYVYYAYPFLILLASASTFFLLDEATSISKHISSRISTLVNISSSLAVIFWLF